MIRFSVLTALTLTLGLSACSSYDLATRSTTPEMGFAAAGNLRDLPALQIAQAQIVVPRSLQVSEANSYYPMGDIVWRGEAFGDRHAQVEAILRDSMAMVQSGGGQGRPALVEITLHRFHALTEKTRYSVGGVHTIRFDLTFRDPVTGQALAPTQSIRADLKGYGGDRAMQAERAGLTQRKRITHHLANVIRAELARPGSMGGNRGITQQVAGLETGAPI